MTLGYVQHRCMKPESLLVIGFFIVLVTVSLLLHAALHLQFKGYMPW